MAILTKTLTQSLLPISGYTDQYYTYRCVVTENSYDTTNNTSNVTITFSVKGPWSPSFYEWKTNYGIIVDDVVKKTGSSSPYISTSYTELLKWTGNVSHNSNGTKSINVGVYLYHSGPSSYLPKQYTSSSPLSMGSVTLTTIPRASSITSVGNVTLGNNCSVKWTPADSNFKYKLKFSLGAWSYTTNYITPNQTNAYTYTGKTLDGTEEQNNTTIYNQLPNSTTGKMTVTLYTYNSGGTQIGSTSSKTFTVTVPSEVKPTFSTTSPITLNPADINGKNILVQGKNKLTISVSGCKAGTGSSIKSYTFSGPGISTTTTNTSVTTSGTVLKTGTLTYKVTVTDNRGRSISDTATITCYSYSDPCFTSFSADRSNTDIKFTYQLEYSPVNSTNDVTVKIYYKKGSNDWLFKEVLTNSTKQSGDYTLSGIDAGSTYTVYATISDNYGGSSKSSQDTIFGESRILNISSDGKGFAIGKTSEKTDEHTNGLFECKWDAKFFGDVTLSNGSTINGWKVPTISTASSTSYSTAIGNNKSRVFTATNQVFITARLDLTPTSTISAGTLIKLGTLNGYLPMMDCAISVYQDTSYDRRFMGYIDSADGSISVRCNTDLSEGTYLIRISTSYVTE